MGARGRVGKGTEGVLSSAALGALVADVRLLMEQGRARAEAAVGRELVRTYHAVGSRIVAERLTGRAGYGSAMVAEVAEAIGVTVRVLQQAVAFARLYPQLPAAVGRLRWSHYRELMRIKDGVARDWYEERAVARGWTRGQLVQAMAEGRHVRALGTGADARSVEGARGAKLTRPRGAVYLYAAAVERVIDGDTLIALVDLGFEVLKRQRVRLAGIDTPGLGEPGGAEATAWVREALARVAFVMLQTVRVDLHGRYVGHVFYAPGVEDKAAVYAKGRYLNQELVGKGLAVVV